METPTYQIIEGLKYYDKCPGVKIIYNENSGLYVSHPSPIYFTPPNNIYFSSNEMMFQGSRCSKTSLYIPDMPLQIQQTKIGLLQLHTIASTSYQEDAIKWILFSAMASYTQLCNDGQTLISRAEEGIKDLINRLS